MQWPETYSEYQTAKAWLESLIPDPSSPDYVVATTPAQIRQKLVAALDRARAFLQFLDNPQQAYRSIHVAGTGGKGSVTTMIAAILRASGEHVGAHVSPYVQIPNEKLIIDGRMIGPSAFAQVVREIRQAYLAFCRRHPQIKPLYGEVWVALTYYCLRRYVVLWAAIETGMGGRFDATNALLSDIAVITNIDYDHISHLGATLEEIAWHKAGIIKAGKPVVTSETKAEPLAVIRQEAQASNAPLFVLNRDFAVTNIRPSGDGLCLDLRAPFASLNNLYVSLRGEYQAVNAACAVMACLLARERHGVDVTEQAIRSALSSLTIPGRMEIMRHYPIVLIDGAHNPQKMRAAAQVIRETYPQRHTTLVIGMLVTKNAIETLQPILPAVERVIVTAPQLTGKPAYPLEQLQAMTKSLKPGIPVDTERDIASAVRKAIAVTPRDGLVFISGSIYMLEHVRNLWYPIEDLLKSLENAAEPQLPA